MAYGSPCFSGHSGTFCVHCNGSLSRSGVRAKTEQGRKTETGRERRKEKTANEKLK